MPTAAQRLMPDHLFSVLSILFNSELLRWLISSLLQGWHLRRFQGIYRVHHHEVCLELLDKEGKQAIYTKRQKMEFLQNGVFAIQDQAWGDGELFATYTCSPGVAVDRYKEGYRWKILISLQKTCNKGDEEQLMIERGINNGFMTPTGNFQTQVDHPTEDLTIQVIFPAERHPRSVSVIEQHMGRTRVLSRENTLLLSEGRIHYEWHVHKPRLYEGYILRWEW